jgi:hypothetical protein
LNKLAQAVAGLLSGGYVHACHLYLSNCAHIVDLVDSFRVGTAVLCKSESAFPFHFQAYVIFTNS